MSTQIALEQPTVNFETKRAEHQVSRSSKADRAVKLIKKFAQSTDPESQEKFKLKLRELQKGLTIEQREDLEKKKDQYLTLSPENTAKAVHEGVKCDGCSQLPIIGTRYKCSECEDFDYCEDCEGRLSHNHPFIQMKKPEQQYSDSSASAQVSSIPGKVPSSQRSKQGSRKWKPLIDIDLTDSFGESDFDTTLEETDDEEDDFADYDEVEEETMQKIFDSEVEEKTQKLSELLCKKDSQEIREFVEENYHLSVEAMVEKWLML